VNFWVLFGPVIVAALLGGGSAGLVGVFTTGLRMPFLAVCSSHAAMAGAVAGLVLQERLGWPVSGSAAGFAGALAGAGVLGFLLHKRRGDPNAAIAVVFSFLLGLTFLGIGLLKGPKSAALGLLWGNIVMVNRGQIVIMMVVAATLLAFLVVFHKELKLVLFSRELAAVLAPEGWIFAALLLLVASVITINLEIVGGLLLFSLISNPALAALQVARSYRAVLICSGLFGALSALGGLAAAYWLNLGAGACIVLFSTLLLGVVHVFARVRERRSRFYAA